MALTPGARLGVYEIVALIGTGGMGEVYRARDTRLDRTVAIKVTPPELAADPHLRARFDREARAISHLSHPHICTLYDVGEADGSAYLVMELLQGQTLADRLRKGALPVEEALKVAIDVADALSAAHKQGIVHRDLKPANIMLTKTGGAKLLDFGLAKAAAPVVSIGSNSGHQTASTDLTDGGTILGTLHYMSPEQVEGQEADARSDIWALGVVLYEMVTGTRPFDGTSAAAIVGSILRDAPALVSTRQPLASPALNAIVQHCLAKDPERRWQNPGDVGLALQSIPVGGAASIGAAPTRRLSAVAAGAAVGAAVVTIGSFMGSAFLASPSVPSPVLQFDVAPPEGARLSPAPVAAAAQLALSPDGRKLAYVALKRRGVFEIYVRTLDSRESRPIPGTEGASFPFWSPDSQFIAFSATGKLRKVPLEGGVSQELCDAPSARSGTWNSDGIILFSPATNRGLVKVSAAGGTPVQVTDLGAEVLGHQWPQFLPDGRHFIYYQRSANPDRRGVYVGDLTDTAPSVRVLASTGMAMYASGYLAYVEDGVLFAVPFDPRTLQVNGSPVRLADHVGYFSGAFGYSAMTVSASGVLAYGPALGLTTSLRWFTRDGQAGGRLGDPDRYSSPRLSIDGRTLVVAIGGETMGDRDIWNIDTTRGATQRVTFNPAADWFPAWTPDGSRVYFGSTRLGVTSIFQRVGLGGDEPVDVGERKAAMYPNDVSSDGKLLAYTQSAENGSDIGVLTLTPQPKAEPFLVTRFNEAQPRFAPNGRFLAYASDESGSFEIYVRSYPPGNQQWKVSLSGGMQPEWRRDGRELYYISTDGKMMRVPVSMDADFHAGAPEALFQVDVPEAVPPYPTDYAVTADGGRFLVNSVGDQPNRPAVTVLFNWTAALKKGS